VKYLLFRRLRI